MNKTISIIIPFYNNETTLAIMLDSIITGKILPHEVFLVDDGSTDRSADIAKEYATRYSFINYVFKEHSGVSASRNYVLSRITGYWTSFLDADDFIEPDMYSNMLNTLAQNANQSTIGCICGYYAHKDGIIKQYSGALNSIENLYNIRKAMFTDEGVRGFLFTRLFKTEVLKRYRFDEKVNICEDLLFQTNLYTNLIDKDSSMNFVCVSKPLYNYIQHNNSLTGKKEYFKKDTFIYEAAFKKINQLIKDEYINDSYNSILMYSMYSLLKVYKSGDKTVLPQIRKLQNLLKTTPCKKKSKRRLLYETAPIIMSCLFKL